VARVRDRQTAISQPIPKLGASIKSSETKKTKHRRSRNVALGTRVLYRRVDRSFAWIHRHIGWRRQEIAKILFYLFLILFLVTLMGHLLRRS